MGKRSARLRFNPLSVVEAMLKNKKESSAQVLGSLCTQKLLVCIPWGIQRLLVSY